MSTRLARACACALLLTGARASAAGFEIPENGAVPLAQGGTGVARFGTAYSLLFNPAGMAWNEGLDVRVDFRLASHAVTFTRASIPGQDFFASENEAGAVISPVIAATYRPRGLLDGKLAFGVGVYPPAGVSHYLYPDPAALKADGVGAADIKAAAGQRYTTIESNTLIVFPTASVAYRALPNLAFGLSAQAVYANIGLRQSIAALGGPEEPDLDAMVTANLTSSLIPSLMLGGAWDSGSGWRIGGSWRPRVAVDASGTFDVTLPEAASGYKVDQKTASLRLWLPNVFRLGTSYQKDKWTASLDLVAEGWGVDQQFDLKPDVVITTPAGKTQKLERNPKCDCVPLRKDWQDTVSVRLGGSYELLPASDGLGLIANAGALFESNAIPSTRQQIDYVTGNRIGGGVGITASLKGFSVTLSALAYVPVTLEITDSTVARASAEPEPPVIIGNGTYTSNVFLAGLGLAYTTPAESK